MEKEVKKEWKEMEIYEDECIDFRIMKDVLGGVTWEGSRLFIHTAYNDPIQIPSQMVDKIAQKDEVLIIYSTGKIIAIIHCGNGEILLDVPIVGAKTGISLGIR